ncbi:HAD family hydrolase [Parvicella tangerina]|uniref:D-ribitol-5-phosphate phosphatase n=1 Tax=Parvicella tangerina TaxID=2829795 RepID=A0A916JQZ9_9FLAO|nr:HAD family phosphatase [Parvicella tangerina]CAG5087011.1 D-ribitol-5-phosphate phosphatase [Parvicella tangerina]
MLDLNDKENIIFDLGGVLLNIDYELTAKAFKKLGLSSFDDLYSQKRQTGLFDQFEKGKITKKTFLSELTEVIPEASEEDVIAAWNAMLLDLPQHRIELLMELGKAFRIFLLSNTNEIHEAAFLKIIDQNYPENVLYNSFERVYLSHRIGFRKPDRECFQLVLDENGLAAEKTIFIDDSIQHIEGAQSAGITAVHLERHVDVSQLFADRFPQASRL